MMKKYGILYCIWDNPNVIKFSEIIEAENLKEAIEKTDRNLEMNVVIPLTKKNIKHLKKLIKSYKKNF
jgi:hypothetical protein